MQRCLSGLAVVFLGYLAIPVDLHAQSAADYNNQGVAWQNKGEYDKAIASFNRALAIDPVTLAPTSIAASPGTIRANTIMPSPTTAKPWPYSR